MTGKVVNLRRARKRRTREEKAKAGDANAARCGVSKAEREARGKEAQRAARDLDGHRRGPRSRPEG